MVGIYDVGLWEIARETQTKRKLSMGECGMDGGVWHGMGWGLFG